MPVPITAHALSTSYGIDAEATLDAERHRAPATVECERPEQLLDRIAPLISAATHRWGRRRLGAVVAGSNAATATELLSLCHAAGGHGPALAQVGEDNAGARALATASRWIALGITDAVLVGAHSGGSVAEQASAWLLLERHGVSEFALSCPPTTRSEHHWDLESHNEPPFRFRVATALAHAIAAGLVVRDGRALPGDSTSSTDIDSIEWTFGGVRFSLEACDP